LYLAGTFKDFHGLHAGDSRKIIGGRCAVRGRSDQDTVFHQAYFGTAFGGGTTQADIGPEPKTIFFIDIYAGDSPEGTVYVRIVEFTDLFRGDVVRRTCSVFGFKLAPENYLGI